MTGALQLHARKYQIPIDTLNFGFRVLDFESEDDVTSGPSDGIYISGLFLEGARWDTERRCLAEPLPGMCSLCKWLLFFVTLNSWMLYFSVSRSIFIYYFLYFGVLFYQTSMKLIWEYNEICQYWGDITASSNKRLQNMIDKQKHSSGKSHHNIV